VSGAHAEGKTEQSGSKNRVNGSGAVGGCGKIGQNEWSLEQDHHRMGTEW